MSEIDLLKRRLDREIAARKQAEQILEQKALELYQANEQLRALNQSLESTIESRTEELAKSQQQFQSLVESAGDIIYNANEQGRCTYVNPITEKILGYSTDELIGKHFTDLVVESHKEEVGAFYVKQIKNREITSYLEFPVVTKSGTPVWLGQRIEIEYDGPIATKITAVARNIQDLVEARNALEASEEKYRGIIEGMELGLLEVDPNGVVVKAYDLFCQMMGYTEEELIGKNPSELFLHPDDIVIIEQQNKDRKEGQTGVYEVRLRKKNGEYIWVVISGAPFYNVKGEMIGSVGIHLDISGQKELQRQLETAKETAERAQKAEKNFLAKMSHEIRTPLNAVIGMSNLLDTTPLNNKQKEYVQDIRYASEVLLGLISEVLDLSKIEAGELTVSANEIDLRQSLTMLIRTLEYRAKDQNTELVHHVATAVPHAIISDQNIINQILLNLIGNAIKFTKNGTISVNVECKKDTDSHVLLEVSVNDTGVGIGKDKLLHVFEKYKQEKGETAAMYGGTGLGLYICKELVQLLGGTIYIESSLNEGTSVIFTMKAEKSLGHSLPLPTESERQTPAFNTDEKYKILVAEDSYLNQKYISSLLDQWGIPFDLAADGVEALDLSQTTKYHLILMDMQMPRKDGYATTEAIKQNSTNPNCQTPVVALTASALLEEKRKALSTGIVQHISKPFTPHQLHHVLQQYLRVEENASTAKPSNPFLALSLPESIDSQQLMELYGNDLEHCLHIASFYLSTIDEELAVLRSAAKEEHKKVLAERLHRIKPTFSMIGLPQISAAIAQIETWIKSEHRPEKVTAKTLEVIDIIAQQQGAVERLVDVLKLNLEA